MPRMPYESLRSRTPGQQLQQGCNYSTRAAEPVKMQPAQREIGRCALFVCYLRSGAPKLWPCFEALRFCILAHKPVELASKAPQMLFLQNRNSGRILASCDDSTS